MKTASPLEGQEGWVTVLKLIPPRTMKLLENGQEMSSSADGLDPTL